MSFSKEHIACTGAVKRAIMSEHLAQQSSDEAACAVMSEHLAQGSLRRNLPSSPRRY